MSDSEKHSSNSTMPSRIDEEQMNSDVTLFDLFAVLWREKLWIFLCVTLSAAVAIYIAVTTVPTYRSEVLIEPTIDEGQSRGGLIAQYAGLPALAGINVDGRSNWKSSFLAKLKSKVFLSQFIRQENLLPELYYKKWNSQKESWDVEDSASIPTVLDGVAFIKNNVLKITDNKKSGLIVIAIEWHDREKTSLWANKLVEHVGSFLRVEVLGDLEKNIKYLTDEFTKTQIVELKEALIKMLESQIKQKTLYKMRSNFAFKVIDPAVTPKEGKHIKPRKRVIAFLGILIGLFIGISLALFKNSYRKSSSKIPAH